MNFTIYNDEKINKKVESDLMLIRDVLLRNFDGIEALALVGGFGRGEGGILIKDGQFVPSNDYDIEMITVEEKKKLGRGLLSLLERRLAKIIGFHWVDRYDLLHSLEKRLAKTIGVYWVHIETRTKASLSNMPYTQYAYDIKYGSYVFYGDKNIFSPIPDMNPEEMPLREGEKLFFARLWCFLGGYSTDFLSRELSDEEKIFLANQLSKPLLAICDCLLFLKKAYHVSYVERFKRFKELYASQTDLISLVEWAFEYKLKPTQKIDFDVIDLYFTTRECYLNIMFEYLKRVHQKDFQNWEHYGENFKGWWGEDKSQFSNKLKKTVRRLIIGQKEWRYFQIRKYLLELYLVVAYNKNRFDESYLKLAQKKAKEITGNDYSDCDWEAMRKVAVELMNI